MMEYAETKSTLSSLGDTNSPQYKAVEWLAQDKVEHGSSWSGYELLQRYVLRVLYHSTGGQNWNNGATQFWFGASSVCEWPEVNTQNLYCNGNTQQVYIISLSGDNLQGTLPDELGLLTSLTLLDLYDNKLTGTIPTQLGQLTALQRLQLYKNQLGGTIPSQIGKLTALNILQLLVNQLTGTLPSQLGQLSGLTGLSLYFNQLTGAIPTEFGRLTALESLYMYFNQFTGTIPSEFGQLTALINLSFFGNKLTGTIPASLTQLTLLQSLSLFYNSLTGQVPSGFCTAPFPDWRADGDLVPTLLADCISEIQCDCCDVCYEGGQRFCWNGSEFSAC